jgi:hypothetical protein
VSIEKQQKIAKLSICLTKLKNDLDLIKTFKKPDLHEIERTIIQKGLIFAGLVKGYRLKVTILRLLCSYEAYFCRKQAEKTDFG